MISTVDHRRTPLLDQLMRQARSPHRRFYMPGHKGGRGSAGSLIGLLGQAALEVDIPELPGLDQLFAPSGVIHQAQTLAADAFGAEQTFFLVNGTSVGLMAAIMTCCSPGDAIIVPRNCHQSIVHGLVLSGAQPIWVEPGFDPGSLIPDCLTPETLQAALEKYPQARAAIAISPTYEGVCGDLKGLVAIAHQWNIPLIVDEAHGAHLCFHPSLPPSALSQGADLVVQSTHKLLGSLTQSSMLHVQGDRINRDRLQTTLTLLQSSSPNYALLASLDAARAQMATQGKQILEQVIQQAHALRQQLQSSRCFSVLTSTPFPSGAAAIDPLKLTLTLEHCELSGFELDEVLSETYQLFAELPTEQTLTFVLGQGNSKADLDDLSQALRHLEKKGVAAYQEASPNPMSYRSQPPRLSVMTPREAFNQAAISVDFEQAIGQISAKIVCPYPPGIPLIFPGEEITPEAIATLTRIRDFGGQIIGLPHPSQNVIEILSH